VTTTDAIGATRRPLRVNLSRYLGRPKLRRIRRLQEYHPERFADRSQFSWWFLFGKDRVDKDKRLNMKYESLPAKREEWEHLGVVSQPSHGPPGDSGSNQF
jgi:hypothetical protein